MKVSRLRKYNVRNISLEKSYTKCDRETIARAFFRKPKLSTSLDQYSKAAYILFFLFAKLKTIKSD